MIERQSIKYVKQVTAEKVYLTMNPFETHSLDFKYKEDTLKGDEQIAANVIKGNLAYKCPSQLIEIDSIAFCFEPTVSLNRK